MSNVCISVRNVIEMKYLTELILSFVLLAVFITVYIALKIFSCSCFTNNIFNDSSRRKTNFLILDADKSLNGQHPQHSTSFNLWCCLCVVANRYRSSTLVYVQNADKIEYGTVNNAHPMNSINTQNGVGGTDVINDVCPICLEHFSEKLKVVKLKCHHGFHSSCIGKWFNKSSSYRNSTCPLCKDTVTTRVVCTSENEGLYLINGFDHQPLLQGINFGISV